MLWHGVSVQALPFFSITNISHTNLDVWHALILLLLLFGKAVIFVYDDFIIRATGHKFQGDCIIWTTA